MFNEQNPEESNVEELIAKVTTLEKTKRSSNWQDTALTITGAGMVPYPKTLSKILRQGNRKPQYPYLVVTLDQLLFKKTMPFFHTYYPTKTFIASALLLTL
jgi:hypothetical protein